MKYEKILFSRLGVIDSKKNLPLILFDYVGRDKVDLHFYLIKKGRKRVLFSRNEC